ncbi:MAG: TAXI family TRAP transporter solute-binding subunit [Fusobacterium perfoetens]|uniref:TAXI family TRAP transporter solute-binding subunit n=1 Tax=Fusobacterium perfoetens TaxID=852 RepID=UPI0023EFFE28|nr:TAXI family TRAP transporter solute-binding subunit [Fusobacterium perfoetens]MCI6152515.1 TAXI family TRAP transporter solute-binding subunit [Fusobacterium perfoetens]MDY3237523.1 TAXI family TRAP transporter solute-binding subunit [Fusobacterium perfoetens]
MNIIYNKKLIIGILILIFNLIGYSEEKKPFISIGTGPIDGVFYPTGVVIAEVIKEAGYNSSAQSTAGSGENIDFLYFKKVEMAISMSDSVHQAYNGVGAYKIKGPMKNLKCITGLHPNFTQIVTLRDSGIKTFEDLKGKRIGIGIYNSGVELNARLLYEIHNMNYKDSDIIYSTPGEIIEQLKSNLLDAIFLTNTIPNEIIYNLANEVPISFVEISDEGYKNLKKKWPFFFRGIISKNDYNIDKSVKTVAVQNLLLVDGNLSEDVVYDITKAFFENLDRIKETHISVKRSVSLENYSKNVEIPFHEGAIRYYKEKNIWK